MTRDELFILTSVDTDQAIAQFETVKNRLLAILPDAVDIQHVGATAIPGCITKGDMDVVVRTPPNLFQQCDAILANNFARNLGSDYNHSFAAFADDTLSLPLGIQLTVMSSAYDTFGKFRDKLCANPVLVTAYNGLKQSHAGCPMQDYRMAKNMFIEEILKS